MKREHKIVSSLLLVLLLVMLREDLRSLSQLREEAKFLYIHKIDTAEQIASYCDTAQTELEKLATERTELHKEKRRVGSTPQRKAELTARTDAITQRTHALRRDIQLCEAILNRSAYLHERCAEAKKQLQLERRLTDEPHRGRGRSGSPDGRDIDDRSGKDSR